MRFESDLVGGPRVRPGGATKAAAVSVPKINSQGRQVDKMVRILDARPQRFRVQYFAVADQGGPAIVEEVVLDAPDFEAASRVAANLIWPHGAIGLRILDNDGRELFEQLKTDRR